MTAIFADEIPPVTSLWSLLPLLFTGIMAIGTWGLYWNARRRQSSEIYPQPLQVEMAKRFADKHEFDELVKENDRQHEEFVNRFRELERESSGKMEELSRRWQRWADAKFGELIKSNDDGRGKLHGRIDIAVERLSELKGVIDEMRRER